MKKARAACISLILIILLAGCGAPPAHSPALPSDTNPVPANTLHPASAAPSAAAPSPADQQALISSDGYLRINLPADWTVKTESEPHEALAATDKEGAVRLVLLYYPAPNTSPEETITKLIEEGKYTVKDVGMWDEVHAATLPALPDAKAYQTDFRSPISSRYILGRYTAFEYKNTCYILYLSGTISQNVNAYLDTLQGITDSLGPKQLRQIKLPQHK